MDIPEYFSENDFHESRLISFEYAETETQVVLMLDYQRDIIGHILEKRELGYDIDIRHLIFLGVKGFTRSGVREPLKQRMNKFFLELYEKVEMDCIIVKKHKGSKYKVEIAFLNSFGQAIFTCTQIECRTKTGGNLPFTPYRDDLLEKINDPEGWTDHIP